MKKLDLILHTVMSATLISILIYHINRLRIEILTYIEILDRKQSGESSFWTEDYLGIQVSNIISESVFTTLLLLSIGIVAFLFLRNVCKPFRNFLEKTSEERKNQKLQKNKDKQELKSQRLREEKQRTIAELEKQLEQLKKDGE